MAQGSYRSTPIRTARIERGGLALRLLRRERDDAGRGVDVDREAVEEVAPEEAVAGARDVVGRHLHAAHARLADLQRPDDDERDVAESLEVGEARVGRKQVASFVVAGADRKSTRLNSSQH